MKHKNVLLILAGFSLLVSAHVARAEDTRQIWRNTNGAQIVHNTWGNCVRSRWDINQDPCSAPPAPQPAVSAYVPPPPPPPPQPQTVIAEEDRTVFFPFDKTYLTGESKTRLSSLADRINSAADVQGAKVVGYADRMGTASYNQRLSKKRAENVRNYLVQQGVVTNNVTETRWVGESQPTAQCPGKMSREQLIQCLAADRKVTVELQYKTQMQMNSTQNEYPSGQNYPARYQAPAPQPQGEIYSRDRYPTQGYLTVPPSMQNQPHAGQPPLPSQHDQHYYPANPNDTGL